MTQQVGLYEWNAVIVREVDNQVTYLLIGYIHGEEILIAKVFTKLTQEVKGQISLGRKFTFRHAMQALKDSDFHKQAEKIQKLMEGGYTGKIVYLDWDFLPDFR